jgi:hypothetical protein
VRVEGWEHEKPLFSDHAETFLLTILTLIFLPFPFSRQAKTYFFDHTSFHHAETDLIDHPIFQT